MRRADIWRRIGLNILYYRKLQGLTQMKLAEKCNGKSQDDGHSSRNYIQRIETGVSSCTVDMLADIADALDIPLLKLFEFRE